MSAGVNLQLKFPAVGFQFRISSRSEFSSSIQRPEPGYGWNRDPARRSIYFNSLQVGKTNSAIFLWQIDTVNHDADLLDFSSQNTVVFSSPVILGCFGYRHFQILPHGWIAGERDEILMGLIGGIGETDRNARRIAFQLKLQFFEFARRSEGSIRGNITAAPVEITRQYQGFAAFERDSGIAVESSACTGKF